MLAVHDLLDEGGFVIDSIPPMGHISVRLDLLEGRFPYAELGLLDRTHVHFCDRFDVFAGAGFAVTDEKPVMVGYPPHWTSLRLRAMELDSTPAFFDMLRVTEADVFQYTGWPCSRGWRRSPRRTATPSPSPPDVMLAEQSRLQSENERLAAEHARLGDQFTEVRAWVVAFKKKPARAVASLRCSDDSPGGDWPARGKGAPRRTRPCR